MAGDSGRCISKHYCCDGITCVYVGGEKMEREIRKELRPLLDQVAALRAENAELKKQAGLREADFWEEKKTCVNEHASLGRIREWLDDPKRKPASIAFTSGPERQIAYLFEGQSQQIGELVEALKDIRSHSVEPFNSAKWFSYINYVSDKVLRSVEQGEK